MRIKLQFLTLFLSTALSAQNIPNWFNTGKVDGYNTTSHLLGFGIGTTFGESMSKAQEQIASQISSEISSELNTIEREITTNNKSIGSSDIEQSIKVKVNQSISGATVIKQESKKESFTLP